MANHSKKRRRTKSVSKRGRTKSVRRHTKSVSKRGRTKSVSKRGRNKSVGRRTKSVGRHTKSVGRRNKSVSKRVRNKSVGRRNKSLDGGNKYGSVKTSYENPNSDKNEQERKEIDEWIADAGKLGDCDYKVKWNLWNKYQISVIKNLFKKYKDKITHTISLPVDDVINDNNRAWINHNATDDEIKHVLEKFNIEFPSSLNSSRKWRIWRKGRLSSKKQKLEEEIRKEVSRFINVNKNKKEGKCDDDVIQPLPVPDDDGDVDDEPLPPPEFPPPPEN